MILWQETTPKTTITRKMQCYRTKGKRHSGFNRPNGNSVRGYVWWV